MEKDQQIPNFQSRTETPKAKSDKVIAVESQNLQVVPISAATEKQAQQIQAVHENPSSAISLKSFKNGMPTADSNAIA